MNLAQASTLNGRGAGLLASMFEISPWLQSAVFRKQASTELNTPDKSTFSSSAARQETAAAVKDVQTPNPTAFTQAIYTREVAIDDLRRLDGSLGLGLKFNPDLQLTALAQKIATEVTNHTFAGTGASYQALGLSYFVKDAAYGGQTAALGFTTTEQAAMNTNISLKLDNADDQKTFVEYLIKYLAAVPGANTIVANLNLYARLTTIAKWMGLAGESMNTFGVAAKTFAGIPIIPVSTDAIPQTESDGSNSDCTSLYIMRQSEVGGVCWATNSGFYFQDFPDFETYPQGVARLAMHFNLVVERTDALLRLSRIRL